MNDKDLFRCSITHYLLFKYHHLSFKNFQNKSKIVWQLNLVNFFFLNTHTQKKISPFVRPTYCPSCKGHRMATRVAISIFLFYFTIFPSILYSLHIFVSLSQSLLLSSPLNSYTVDFATVQFSLFSGHHLPLPILLYFCKHNSHFEKALPNPLGRSEGPIHRALSKSSSASPKSTDDKSVIVRVKRKAFQSPLDAFYEFEFSLSQIFLLSTSMKSLQFSCWILRTYQFRIQLRKVFYSFTTCISFPNSFLFLVWKNGN